MIFETCHLFRMLGVLGGLVAIGSIGCGEGSQREPSAPAVPPPPRQQVTLRVVVDGDSDLVESIARLAGEWHDHSGGELIVAATDTPFSSVTDGDEIDADVIVFPSRLLGVLTHHGILRPVRGSTLDDEELRWSDVHPLLRNFEAVIDSRVMALPLGSLVPLLAYRQDLFESRGIEPPNTWEEYQTIIDRFVAEQQAGPDAAPSSSPALPSQATLEPLAGSWAAYTMLARAAAYVQHRSEEGRLFAPDTMKPRLDRPPFVRALTELQRAAVASDGSVLRELEGDFVLDRLREGRAAMGICWPVAAASDGASIESGIGFAELPGSAVVFNPGVEDWTATDRQLGRATLLGSRGRWIGVTQSSRNPASAFRLLAWLASPEMSRLAGRHSRSAGPSRQSQMSPSWWRLGAWTRRESQAATNALATAWQRDEMLMVPRIGQIDRYLSELAAGVRRAVFEGGDAAEELQSVAQRWEAITDEANRAAQVDMYGRQLIGGNTR